MVRTSLRPRKTPDDENLERIYARLAERSNVFGSFIGRKSKEGKRSRRSSIVCLVDRKLGREALLHRDRIPRTVSWRERQSRRSLATDVEEAPPRFEFQTGPIFGPGDQAKFGGEVATVGASIQHPEFGICVTTAAHLIPESEPDDQVVRLQSDDVLHDSLLKRRRYLGASGETDYAILQLDAGAECDNLYMDRSRIGPPFDATGHQDVGKKLFVLTPQQEVAVECLGVKASFTVDGRRFRNMILTEPGTVPGFSGASLVDRESRVWGFLLGILSGKYSVFMPATTLLFFEGAKLR